MSSCNAHKWAFRPRFKAGSFGWRSDLPIKRIKEAVAEIRKVARRDEVLGAEGAVIFLEKVSPAIEHVDSSSGAIGTAVNRAIDTLVPIVATASVNDKLREKWLDRLWHAVEADEIPYIELLPDHWGDLCATPERASRWADRFIEGVQLVWRPDKIPGAYFKGTAACLSALHAAGRHDELLKLLELAPQKFWHDRKWGVRALVALEQPIAAIRYAEETRGLNQCDSQISSTCEEILLSAGRWREAYDRYALQAHQHRTYLATFRAIAERYPDIEPHVILHDLVNSTPGQEGKWFAAAKSVGLFAEAAELADKSPCDPKTLTRATRDFAGTEPEFALTVGMAALKWMLRGYGYELSAGHVTDAFDFALDAARHRGCEGETVGKIQRLLDGHKSAEPFIQMLLSERINAFANSSAS